MRPPHTWMFFVLFVTLLLQSCNSIDRGVSINDEQAKRAAWEALKPNTSSQNAANWEAIQVEKVKGQDVLEDFKGVSSPGCWMGPEIPGNEEINAEDTYWLVVMKPRPATPIPWPTEIDSPTAPPNVPEPFLYEARLLLHAESGKITARRLLCVIY